MITLYKRREICQSKQLNQIEVLTHIATNEILLSVKNIFIILLLIMINEETPLVGRKVMKLK